MARQLVEVICRGTSKLPKMMLWIENYMHSNMSIKPVKSELTREKEKERKIQHPRRTVLFAAEKRRSS